MATKFADFDLATGLNDGTSWADAFQTLQAAHDGSSAGDVVLCKGTDSLSSTVTFTNDGAYDGGFIKFIGVASSYSGIDPVAGNTGGNDRAVIDAQNGAFSALTFNAASYVWLENFEIKNAGNTGTAYHGMAFITASSDNCVFVNVYSHHHKGIGFYGNSLCRWALFFRCRAAYNTSSGFFNPRYSALHFCRADSNDIKGFYGYNNTFYGCVANSNGDDGFYIYGGSAYNCVAHGNSAEGFDLALLSDPSALVGCRSTNNNVGIKLNTATHRRALLGCYCANNATADIVGYWDEVLIDGVSSVTTGGTENGYADQSNSDFNLTNSAEFRRLPIVIP